MRGVYCMLMRGVYCRLMRGVYCRLMKGVYCRLMKSVYCRLMRGVYCRLMRGLYCRLMRGVYCRLMKGVYCRLMRGVYCRLMRGVYCRLMNLKIDIWFDYCPSLTFFIFVTPLNQTVFLSQLRKYSVYYKENFRSYSPKKLVIIFFDKLWQLHSKIYQLVIILCCYILYFCLSSSVVLYNWCLVESYTMNMEQEEHKNRSKLYSNTASIT